MADKNVIVKIRQTVSGQKLVTIPKDSNLEVGEYVLIKRLPHQK